MTVADAIPEGRLATLEALILALALEIDAASKGRSMTQTAPLAKQLREALAERDVLLRALPQESIVDDLAAKRNRRRTADPEAASPAAADS